jgi:SpoU rRNA methylase family enzyme
MTDSLHATAGRLLKFFTVTCIALHNVYSQAAEVAINKMLNNDVYKRNLHLQELEMALELAKARVFELQQSAEDANVDLRKYGLAPEQLQVSVADICILLSCAFDNALSTYHSSTNLPQS